MKVGEIWDYLDGLFVFGDQPPEDNSGLLIGSREAAVSRVMLCLDVSDAVIRQAVDAGVDLIVSHHPVIFDALRRVEEDSRVWKLVRHRINVISLHIPLDETPDGANFWLCEKLGLTPLQPFGEKPGASERTLCEGWIGSTKEPVKPNDFAVSVSEKLGCGVSFCDGGREITRVAVCGGSGGFLLDGVLASGAQAFVSSQFKHHQLYQAQEAGVTLIDGTHFATEIHIPQRLYGLLSARFGQTEFLLADETAPSRWVGGEEQ